MSLAHGIQIKAPSTAELTASQPAMAVQGEELAEILAKPLMGQPLQAPSKPAAWAILQRVLVVLESVLVQAFPELRKLEQLRLEQPFPESGQESKLLPLARRGRDL